MAKKRIVITGGPGTGKTSIINKLEASDFFCFHEIIRDMTKEILKNNVIDSNPIISVSDPYQFNSMILNGRIDQFKKGLSQEDTLIFYDRGIPDVLAYMRYFDQPIDKLFTDACKENKYDQVFLLPPWKEIYVEDIGRYESFEQAQEIHNHLVMMYEKFGYKCHEVPFGSIENRFNFIIQNIV
ncbi:ATP-binding protein [Aquimarina sp. 2201CG1-2-11]|uniref:AAA family ATPase n=1 Tax=Aquimarina discodermiae TaxID=3231043 RepID=UPI00346278E8